MNRSGVARTVIRARSVPLYAALACLTISAGLASRRYPDVLPGFVARSAGDTLWAALVFWLLALVWRRLGTGRLAATSLVIAGGVELSQLYRAPWIDAIRATRLGALALGTGFLWSDLVCYTVGVGLAAGLDRLITSRGAHQVR